MQKSHNKRFEQPHPFNIAIIETFLDAIYQKGEKLEAVGGGNLSSNN